MLMLPVLPVLFLEIARNNGYRRLMNGKIPVPFFENTPIYPRLCRRSSNAVPGHDPFKNRLIYVPDENQLMFGGSILKRYT
jgi:hypothetical protein